MGLWDIGLKMGNYLICISRKINMGSGQGEAREFSGQSIASKSGVVRKLWDLKVGRKKRAEVWPGNGVKRKCNVSVIRGRAK